MARGWHHFARRCGQLLLLRQKPVHCERNGFCVVVVTQKKTQWALSLAPLTAWYQRGSCATSPQHRAVHNGFVPWAVLWLPRAMLCNGAQGPVLRWSLVRVVWPPRELAGR